MPNCLGGLVRDFVHWLKSASGQLLAWEWSGKQRHYQEMLRESKVEALSEEEVIDLFANLWAARFAGVKSDPAKTARKIIEGNGLEKVKEWLKDLLARGEKRLSPEDFDDLVGRLKGIGHAMLSELLCLRFPERYWIWNRQLDNAIRKLEQYKAVKWEQPSKGTEGQKYFAYQKVLDSILSAMREVPEISETLGREPSYYSDADMFVWWIAGERKVWRMAPGENAEWWDECRDKNCILIGWREAAQQAPNGDFSKVESKDAMKELLQRVYKQREGVRGWHQVWAFVREMKQGDIIVAKRGTREVIGIGIVISDYIPPNSSEHPLGENHDWRHARKVDWRIDEPVSVDFNLGTQTLIEEAEWNKIVEAYKQRGIDVYERLWGQKVNEQPNQQGNKFKLSEYFKVRGFYFTDEQIATFYAALKTKGFVILSGLSGTGKTKLAELFAELFATEQEEEEPQEVGETDIVLDVQPYMLKYKRFIIPVRYWEMLQPLSIGEELKIEIVVGEASERCKLKRWEHPANPQGYTQLLLKGKVAQWFVDNLRTGDRFKIEPQYDDDGNLQSLNLMKLEKRKVRRLQTVHLFLSVRPYWRDSKALLGYYNPLTERYESTPLLKFLLRARDDYEKNGDNAKPYFVILDEMNLSHVEYYFADFLSVLESGRDERGWTKEPLRLHSFKRSIRDQDEQEIPPEFHLPPNLYIIGTVNIDETTYMFSPKVLDRAFTIEFRDVDFSDYPKSGSDSAKQIADQIRDAILNDLRNGGKFCAVAADKGKIKRAIEEGLGDAKQQLEELNRRLQPYDLHFGYRVLDEIALFVRYAKSLPEEVGKALNGDEALDYAVLMKVLPKFHGPRQKLERPLREILKWSAANDTPEWVKDLTKQPTLQDIVSLLGKLAQPQKRQEGAEKQEGTNRQEDAQQQESKFRYPATAKKALQMLRQLYETGFASFAQ
ncbi:MAG: hypothetical protein QXS01_04310 [Candidatus Bathyarchaeia archaeon]